MSHFWILEYQGFFSCKWSTKINYIRTKIIKKHALERYFSVMRYLLRDILFQRLLHIWQDVMKCILQIHIRLRILQHVRINIRNGFISCLRLVRFNGITLYHVELVVTSSLVVTCIVGCFRRKSGKFFWTLWSLQDSLTSSTLSASRNNVLLLRRSVLRYAARCRKRRTLSRKA